MFQEAAHKMEVVMKLLQCNRRKQTPTASADTGEVKLPSQEKPWMSPVLSAQNSDLSTDDVPEELSGSSAGEILTSSSVGGSADSDMETETKELQNHPSSWSSGAAPNLPKVQRASPFWKSTLRPPPGLDAPDVAQVANAADSSWNPRAAPFVPSFSKPQQSAPKEQLQQSDNLMALKVALDRLNPGEIATMKSLLDAKMRKPDTFSAPPRRSIGQSSRGPNVANDILSCLQASHQQTNFAEGSFSKFDEGPLSRRDNGLGVQPWHRTSTPFQGTRTSAPRTGVTRTKVANDPDGPMDDNSKQDSGDSLSTILRELSFIDNARVLTLRKISRLGLDSSDVLQTYFSKFGTVERIMVSHAQSKCSQTHRIRVRPAVLGFAVMSKAEEVEAALKHGAAHAVAGVEINVLPFQSHSID